MNSYTNEETLEEIRNLFPPADDMSNRGLVNRIRSLKDSANSYGEAVNELHESGRILGWDPGADVIKAILPAVKSLATEVDLADEEVDRMKRNYRLLADEMVYCGNSVQHWYTKAMAYKECAGVIADLKQVLGVTTPAEVAGKVAELVDKLHRAREVLDD